MKKWSLYIHTNKINGKQYVGITSREPSKRWNNGKAYINDNTYFGNAIQKYGWDNFEHAIIFNQCLTEQEAKEKEKEYIHKLNTKSPNGYNLTLGGEGKTGWIPSQSTREIWSKQRKGNKSTLGYHHTEETKKTLSVKHKKENLPSEAIQRYREKAILRWKNPEYRIKQIEKVKEGISKSDKIYGRKMSEKQKRILADARTEKCSGSNNNKAIKVWCIELNKKFDTIKEAGEFLGAKQTTYKKIGDCCSGLRNTCIGYHWMFYEDYLNSTKNSILEILKKSNNTKGSNNGRAKSVYCNELNKNWGSAKEAGDDLHINAENIRRCCRGEIDNYNNYHFLYFKSEV